MHYLVTIREFEQTSTANHYKSILKEHDFFITVNILGSCPKGCSDFLSKIKNLSHVTYPVSGFLSDSELDKLLLDSDFLVCCNKYSFFGDFKGSGIFGDVFKFTVSIVFTNMDKGVAFTNP